MYRTCKYTRSQSWINQSRVGTSWIPSDRSPVNTDRWVTPQVLVITRDSIPGYTTYRLVVQLQPEARNVYAVFGTSGRKSTTRVSTVCLRFMGMF